MPITGRDIFDTIADIYDAVRPQYTKKIIDKIVNYASLNSKSNIIEIGSGSGQATISFLYLNCPITCIEPGKRMCDIAINKFHKDKNVKIVNVYFEDFQCEENKYDLLLSATAFHWVQPKIGFPKMHKLLKNGASYALLWHKYGNEGDGIFTEIRNIYSKYANFFASIEKVRSIEAGECETNKWIYDSGLFDNHCVIEDKFIIKYSSDDYIKLLKTHSDHQLLERSVLNELSSEIQTLIENNGGVIKKTIKTSLNLGKVKK